MSTILGGQLNYQQAVHEHHKPYAFPLEQTKEDLRDLAISWKVPLQ